MSDYLTQRGRILSEMARSDLTAQAGQALRDAVDAYKHIPFYFNEAYSETSTSDGREWYDLPSDFMQAETLKITISGGEYELIPRPWEYIEQIRYNDAHRGQPSQYCIRQTQLRLYPIPSATYVMTMAYIKDLGEFTATSSLCSTESAWTQQQHAGELIKVHAKVDLYENTLMEEQSYITANQLRRREEEIFFRLKAQTSSQRGTGRITPVFF